MPILSKAQVTVGPVTAQTDNVDIAPYLEFMSGLQVGSKVILPLEEGENARAVMRTLNRAAKQTGVRLGRVNTDLGSVGFRVRPLEKRSITMSEEVREARRQRMALVRAARNTTRII